MVQHIAHLGHDRKERRCRNRIEQITNLVVARNLVHPKPGRGIVSALLLLHPDLAVEKRRSLREEYGKGRQGCVLHLITPVVALSAPVRQRPKRSPNLLDQGCGVTRQRDGGNGGNNVGASKSSITSMRSEVATVTYCLQELYYCAPAAGSIFTRLDCRSPAANTRRQTHQAGLK